MFFQLFTVFIVALFRKLLNVDSQSSVTTFKIKTVGNSFHTIAVRVTITIAVRIAVYQSRSQSQSRSKSSTCSDDLSHQSQSPLTTRVVLFSDSDCDSSKGSCTQWSQSRVIVLVTILVAVIVLFQSPTVRDQFFSSPGVWAWKWQNSPLKARTTGPQIEVGVLCLRIHPGLWLRSLPHFLLFNIQILIAFDVE